MKKLLTVGMAVYDDFSGVFFTIQAIRMFQIAGIEDLVEFVVIDNNPSSQNGMMTKNFVENWLKQKYIPYTNKISTSVRNEIFKHAQGTYTLCLDSHVLLEKDGISSLLNFYEKNPNSKDLIQGPLWYDDLKSCSTHFEPIWRDIMYGVWDFNKEAYDKGLPFEIPMMGLGLFSCKTDNWQGFNEKFKGFGGEEGYIHEKFRKAGGKCICLPDLKWNHRFGRPDGTRYPNYLEDRIWNYFIGWLEILKDPKDPFFSSIQEAFTERVPDGLIKSIFDKAIKESKNK